MSLPAGAQSWSPVPYMTSSVEGSPGDILRPASRPGRGVRRSTPAGTVRGRRAGRTRRVGADDRRVAAERAGSSRRDRTRGATRAERRGRSPFRASVPRPRRGRGQDQSRQPVLVRHAVAQRQRAAHAVAEQECLGVRVPGARHRRSSSTGPPRRHAGRTDRVGRPSVRAHGGRERRLRIPPAVRRAATCSYRPPCSP